MNDAQTLTERQATGVLTFTCSICGTDVDTQASVDLLRYPTGTTYATGVITNAHACQPKETR